MRLCILVVVLLAAPIAIAPTAAAWPPVCIEREVGSEGGKVYVHAWTNCGTGVDVVLCPKDGFCTQL